MHLVASNRVADVLRARLGAADVVPLSDPLSVGPVGASLGDIGGWLRERATFWESVMGQAPARPTSEGDVQRVLDAPEVTVWAGVGVDDQLLLGWLCARVARAETLPAIRLVQFTTTPTRSGQSRIVGSAAHLSDDELINHPAAAPVSPQEVERFGELWSAWVAPDPTALAALASAEGSVRGAVAGALLDRYPDVVHGLGRWDLALLRNVAEHGPRVTRAIGHTLGECMDGLDYIGDFWLLARVRRLGTDPAPLLDVEASSPAMRDTTAMLTDAGRSVLAGHRAAHEFRALDDWVGGVHLSTAQDSVWLRRPGGLVRCTKAA
jgi:hypothetical protein